MNGEIIKKVANLKPGFNIVIDRCDLQDEFPSRIYNEVEFTPADNLLENIVGSSYEFSYQINFSNGNTTFHRLKKPLEGGLRSYTSPDRR